MNHKYFLDIYGSNSKTCITPADDCSFLLSVISLFQSVMEKALPSLKIVAPFKAEFSVNSSAIVPLPIYVRIVYAQRHGVPEDNYSTTLLSQIYDELGEPYMG